MWCDFHPAAIERSIGKGRQQSRSTAVNAPLRFSSTRTLRNSQNFHRRRNKRDDRREHAEQVSPMSAQPPWQLVRTPGYLPVEADASHAGKIGMRRGVVLSGIRSAEASDHSHINRTHRTYATRESLPGFERVAHSSQSQRTGQIIATAGRHHEYRQSQSNQLLKVPM